MYRRQFLSLTVLMGSSGCISSGGGGDEIGDDGAGKGGRTAGSGGRTAGRCGSDAGTDGRNSAVSQPRDASSEVAESGLDLDAGSEDGNGGALDARRDGGGPAVTPCVVLCGQSNVGFHGNATSLPPELRLPQAGTLYWSNFETVSRTEPWTTPGIVPVAPIDGHFAYEITLAQRLKEQGRAPLIVKSGRGGSSLYQDWSPPSGAQFTNLLQHVEQARRELGTPSRIVGVIFSQGGADAKSQAISLAYGDNLACFIEALRAAWAEPVHAYISAMPAHAPFTYAANVRAGQEAWVATDGNATLIDTDLIAMDGSGHYSDEGLQILGRCYADAIVTGSSACGVSL